MFYLTTWNEPCWSSTSSQIITLTNDSTSSQTRKVFPGVFVNNHLHTHPIPFSNSARICTDVRFQIIYFPTHKIEARIQSYCAYIIRFHYTYIFNTLYLINNSSLFQGIIFFIGLFKAIAYLLTFRLSKVNPI